MYNLYFNLNGTHFEINLLHIAGIVALVFLCMAGYTLCKRRGYNKAWMGAVPVLNGYAIGGIADNISYYHGKQTHFRIWMLFRNLGSLIMGVLLIVWMTIMLFQTASGRFAGAEGISWLLGGALSLLAALLLIGAGTITCSVFYYIGLYRIYQDYAPKNAAAFLVLSIVFSAASLEGFFLFTLRNRPAATLSQSVSFQYAPRG